MLGVDATARPNDAFPPTRCRMAASALAGGMTVARPRVADQDGVAGIGVELAPRLVGDRDVAQLAAAFEGDRALRGDGEKLATPGRVTGSPRTRDREWVSHLTSSRAVASISSAPGETFRCRHPVRPAGDHIPDAITVERAPWVVRPRLPDRVAEAGGLS